MVPGHLRALVAHPAKAQACIGMHGRGESKLTARTREAKDFPQGASTKSWRRALRFKRGVGNLSTGIWAEANS